MGSKFQEGNAFVLLDQLAKSGTSNWSGSLLNIFLDAVFPPKCLVCSRLFKPATKRSGSDPLLNDATEITDPFAASYRLLTFFCCSGCVNAFAAISSPMCTCCGIPFKSQKDQDHLCGDCITRPKKFRMARAAMACDQQLMAVIHRFKYAAKTQLARPLGGMMLSVFMRQWEGKKVDLILPVPLHAQKVRSRGFNQSYLLIHRWKALANKMHMALPDIPIHTDVLIRSKATIPQTGLGRRQRLKNVEGVFSLQFPEKVYGKKLLVVDDVYTTGATVNECARTLLEFGAERVDVLTLARAI
jgi:ComF family protein